MNKIFISSYIFYGSNRINLSFNSSHNMKNSLDIFSMGKKDVSKSKYIFCFLAFIYERILLLTKTLIFIKINLSNLAV